MVMSVITERLGDLDTDMFNLPHRKLVSPDTLDEVDPSPAIPDTTDPGTLALAEKLRQAEAKLEHETINRIHAEQILQAHIGDQVAAPTAIQEPPADTPQDVISDTQNPLDTIRNLVSQTEQCVIRWHHHS